MPPGLGWLLSARAVGGTIGLLVIATTSARWRTVGSFALFAGVFGVALIAFAVTPMLVIALILAGVIGAAGAAVDAIGQAQLQHAVADEQRGAAMGIWMFCLGLGLAGHIETGVLGGLLGAPFAQIPQRGDPDPSDAPCRRSAACALAAPSVSRAGRTGLDPARRGPGGHP